MTSSCAKIFEETFAALKKLVSIGVARGGQWGHGPVPNKIVLFA